MNLRAGFTGEGISLRVGDGAQARLKPSLSANQIAPRGFYVYSHSDDQSVPFYIGKGAGKRAWNDKRHFLWHWYVDKHLKGKYTVSILVDDLTEHEAELAEGQWIVQESETLVNWQNFGRKTDFAALDQYHQLKNKNRELVSRARALEKSAPEQAVAICYQALSAISEYATIQGEGGLIGRLLAEHRQEHGYSGELVVLDRLTVCLKRLGRLQEAEKVVSDYFEKYKADKSLAGSAAIVKRVASKRVT